MRWRAALFLQVVTLAAIGLFGGSVQAGSTYYSELGQLVRASRSVAPLGPELFGDKVNHYNGSLELVQTDVSLPGNNALPVAVGRRFAGNISLTDSPGYFGRWELEIPRIQGVFASSAPFVNGWSGTDRCTRFSAPPTVVGSANEGSWLAKEYWRGNMLYIPGAGEKEILVRQASGFQGPTTSGKTYPLLTKDNWALGCIPLATGGGTGEGFIAQGPDGVEYRFDWMVTRNTSALYRDTSAPTALASKGGSPSASPSFAGGEASIIISPQVSVDYKLARVEVWILPTQIRDRFGNTVTFEYDTTYRWRLNRMSGSDGRSITFTYDGSSNRIKSVSDGTRTWTYNYAPNGDLTGVTLPDSTGWTFSIDPMFLRSEDLYAGSPGCGTDGNGMVNGQTYVAVIGHPSGATGRFETTSTEHARGNADPTCFTGNGGSKLPLSPFYFATPSITAKEISGPGLPTMRWSYTYSPTAGQGSSSSCTNCPTSKWMQIVDPYGRAVRHTHGIRVGDNEGQLLRSEVFDQNGALLAQTDQTYQAFDAGPYPALVGASVINFGDGYLHGRLWPIAIRTRMQQGAAFSSVANSFDALARPLSVTRSGPGGSITEVTSYADNTNLWVMSQVDQVVVGGLVSLDNDYDPTTATLVSTKRFGVLQSTQVYNADGTLASKSDGAGNKTLYANYKRGLAQTVTYPTGASETAVVNDIGLITSATDAAGYSTAYGYDAMGRLASITPPSGFAATGILLQPVSSAEYGLAAGHWRQTVTRGGAVTATYLDALWRPVMTRTYDAGDEASTRKVVAQQYDAEGHVTFASYPARDIANYSDTPDGTRTSYDALGRVTQVQADSELGVLTTSTAYLSGFQTQITNPRGKATTQSFWALDDPSKAQLAAIAAPAGVNVSIARDAFGKPISITRGGTNSGYTSSVTRSYVYDAGQRLCKTVEPEVGATVQTYDAAGNIAWKAPGQNLPGTTTCDDTNVPVSAKLTYGYDTLNRLTSVTYGDGSPGVTRTYTADGLLETLTSNGSTWTYGYNALRKLATETLSYAGQNYSFNWGYNTAGDLSTLTYPDGSAVAYSPNALGEARSVSGYASGVSYHPNCAVSGYTLANGVVHSLTQNTRGLPLVNADAGVMQDQYAYDANGNVASITDLQEGVFNRSMGYDDLDRLTSTSAPGVWGSATYAYDPVDNLRAATVGSRASTFNFGANNQLASVTTNGSTATYGFDARGNLTAKGAQTFSFDLGNRLASASLGGSYAYDGHGRRFKIVSTDGSTRLQFYSQQGQLLWAETTGSGSLPAQVSYSCASGTLVNGQCVTTSSYGATPSYTCNPGDSLSGSTCTHTTSNSYGATVTGYSCNAGDSLSGSTCTHTTTSTYGGTATGYSCNLGDSLSGSTCTHTTTSTYGGTATGYSCNSGDSLSGSTCTHTTASTYGGTATGYSCNAGDSLSGSTCTHTGFTPATATYSCPNGYNLSGSTCTTSITTAATVSYNCSPFTGPVAYSGGVNGNACTEQIAAASGSEATQTCTDDGSANGYSLIRAQLKSGKIYTCYFMPKVTYSCSSGTLNGNQCTTTSSQPASVSYSCSAGTLSGSQCVSSNSYGAAVTGYSCNAGDSLSGSTCMLAPI